MQEVQHTESAQLVLLLGPNSSPIFPFHLVTINVQHSSEVSLGSCFSLGVSSLACPGMSHMECNYNHHNGYYANAKKALRNYAIKLMIFYMKIHSVVFPLGAKTLQTLLMKTACWSNSMCLPDCGRTEASRCHPAPPLHLPWFQHLHASCTCLRDAARYLIRVSM